jgi:hypothetical protein
VNPTSRAPESLRLQRFVPQMKPAGPDNRDADTASPTEPTTAPGDAAMMRSEAERSEGLRAKPKALVMTETTTTTNPTSALLGWIGLALAMAKVQRRRVVPKRPRPLHRV